MGNIIISDIDGTIADIDHRLHFIEGNTKNWDGFFGAAYQDKPYEDIIKLLRCMQLSAEIEFADMLYFTGRSESIRDLTSKWLDRWRLPNGEVRMRKLYDRRPDFEVKADMLQGLTPKDVWFILEDRDQVVQMWREKGFRVLQVADGKF